jgi:hypothetical protein
VWVGGLRVGGGGWGLGGGRRTEGGGRRTEQMGEAVSARLPNARGNPGDDGEP